MHSSGLPALLPSFRLLPSLFVALRSGVTICPSLPGLAGTRDVALLGCNWPPYVYPKAKRPTQDSLSFHQLLSAGSRTVRDFLLGVPLLPRTAFLITWFLGGLGRHWLRVPHGDLSLLIGCESPSNMTLHLHNRFISPLSAKGGQVLTEPAYRTMLRGKLKYGFLNQEGSVRFRYHLICLISVYKSHNLLN